MEDFIVRNEREIYSVTFFFALAVIAFWEGLAPRRALTQSLRTRWLGNFGLAVIDIALVRLLLPVAAATAAIVAQHHGIGIFNLWQAPYWLAALAGILTVDFARYLQHFLLHKISFLWRLHRVHHADLDYDFTVSLRFHPLEAIYSTLFVVGAVFLVGPPAAVVAVFEAITAISATFVHANARTWSWVERFGRWLIVTPDMHRVHHSILRAEQNSNFSGVFSFWDRLFGTYQAEPARGHTAMDIGLADERRPICLRLGWMLLAPFRK